MAVSNDTAIVARQQNRMLPDMCSYITSRQGLSTVEARV